MTLHIDVDKTFDEYHEIPCLMILIPYVALFPNTNSPLDAVTLLTSHSPVTISTANPSFCPHAPAKRTYLSLQPSTHDTQGPIPIILFCPIVPQPQCQGTNTCPLPHPPTSRIPHASKLFSDWTPSSAHRFVAPPRDAITLQCPSSWYSARLLRHLLLVSRHV
jgi:hypothetical protein